MYNKEIIYMGLHKDGSRVGSAGFLKAEKRDKTSILTMTVKNLPLSIEGRFPVRYCLGTAQGAQAADFNSADMAQQSRYMDQLEWKEEDGITLRDGGGVWKKEEAEASERIYVQILLPNGYLVEGKSKAALKQEQPKEETQPEKSVAIPPSETTVAQAGGSASVQQPVSVIEPAVAVMRETAPVGWNVPAAEPTAAAPRETAPDRWNVPAAEPTAAAAPRDSVPAVSASSQTVMPGRPPLMADALAIEGLKEDKWEQILDTYDQIHPYGDDRVYVKIAPKDFIILSGSCQHLVNNSFLLHGFYNYRYVILGKGENALRELAPGGYAVSSQDNGEYYLGVPGVFYEREKMVALMFGFEAFECESGDPKPGDFGYYLRKVEL